MSIGRVFPFSICVTIVAFLKSSGHVVELKLAISSCSLGSCCLGTDKSYVSLEFLLGGLNGIRRQVFVFECCKTGFVFFGVESRTLSDKLLIWFTITKKSNVPESRHRFF